MPQSAPSDRFVYRKEPRNVSSKNKSMRRTSVEEQLRNEAMAIRMACTQILIVIGIPNPEVPILGGLIDVAFVFSLSFLEFVLVQVHGVALGFHFTSTARVSLPTN